MDRAHAVTMSTRQDLALKLWVVLSRAHAAVELRAREQVATHGLTLPEFGVLEALHHKGPMLLGELQRKILVSSGGITYVVDRLEAKKLVERTASPDDRRARFASLTRDGERLIKRIFPEHAAVIEQTVSTLAADDQRTAVRLLRDLGKGASAMD
jgi:MarR family transcriptional regulator, 2-MHQ and catechol-resistance regulon repressor